MAIEITGPPVPIESPRFAGVTLRVPLSETPSSAWLNVLVAQDKLPGKGHRVDGCAIDLHLGQGDRDVRKALRDLEAAITNANTKYEAARTLLEQQSRGADMRVAAAIKKIAPICEEWWAEKGASAPSQPLPELPSSAAQATAATPDPK